MNVETLRASAISSSASFLFQLLSLRGNFSASCSDSGSFLSLHRRAQEATNDGSTLGSKVKSMQEEVGKRNFLSRGRMMDPSRGMGRSLDHGAFSSRHTRFMFIENVALFLRDANGLLRLPVKGMLVARYAMLLWFIGDCWPVRPPLHSLIIIQDQVADEPYIRPALASVSSCTRTSRLKVPASATPLPECRQMRERRSWNAPNIHSNAMDTTQSHGDTPRRTSGPVLNSFVQETSRLTQVHFVYFDQLEVHILHRCNLLILVLSTMC